MHDTPQHTTHATPHTLLPTQSVPSPSDGDPPNGKLPSRLMRPEGERNSKEEEGKFSVSLHFPLSISLVSSQKGAMQLRHPTVT